MLSRILSRLSHLRMNINPFTNVFRSMFPLCTFRTIENYLSILRDLIENGPNSRHRLWIYIIYVQLIYSIIRHSILYQFVVDKNPVLALILGNFSHVTSAKNISFVVTMFCNCYAIIFYLYGYLNVPQPLLSIYERMTSKILPIKDLAGYSTRTVMACSIVIILNLIQIFLIIAWILVLEYIYLTVRYLSSNWYEFQEYETWAWVSLIGHGWLEITNLFAYLAPNAIMASMNVWVLLGFVCYNYQILIMLKRLELSRVLPARVFRIIHHYNIVIYYILRLNTVYKNYFLIALITMPTLSIYVNIGFFIKQNITLFDVTMLAFTSHQMFGIIFIHVFINFITTKINRTPKKIWQWRMGWAGSRVYGTGNLSLVMRLRLMLFYWKCASKRKWGLTYSNMGLVSSATFLRFLFLYAEFLMFTYKIFRYWKVLISIN